MHFLRKLDNDCQKQSKRRCEKINLDMSDLFFIFSLDKSPHKTPVERLMQYLLTVVLVCNNSNL